MVQAGLAAVLAVMIILIGLKLGPIVITEGLRDAKPQAEASLPRRERQEEGPQSGPSEDVEQRESKPSKHLRVLK